MDRKAIKAGQFVSKNYGYTHTTKYYFILLANLYCYKSFPSKL